MKILMILIAVIIMMAGCTVNRQLTDLTTGEEEALVGGRLKVLYNGEDVTERSMIYFNEIMTGKYNYRPDSTGYLITRLPRGECYLSRISYENFFYNFQVDHLDFDLNDNQKITYLGDLTINWVGPKYKMSGMFGLVGAIADEMVNDGNIEIYARNNLEEFSAYLAEHYNTSRKIEYYQLNFPDPDDFQAHKVFSDRTTNPENLTFNLTNNEKCYGKLRLLKKNEIYVEDGKKLYVFKRKRLISITDSDQNDVTEEVLQQTDFEKINFNSYEVKDL
ncbi:MAG: hypothetical protein K9N06_01190 [Candidatus Cloacimonetes bacterium]|nr:hypothetical protein [Candidatus Cloacimonadota bacterium]